MVDLSSFFSSSSRPEISGPLDMDLWMACCLMAITFQLFRLSIDSIQTASQKTSKDFVEEHHTNKVKQAAAGTAASDDDDNKNNNKEQQASESDPLIPKDIATITTKTTTPSSSWHHPLMQPIPARTKAAVWSFRVQLLLIVLLLTNVIMGWGAVVPSVAVWASLGVVLLGALLTLRDLKRERLGTMSRVFYLASAITMWVPICYCYYTSRPTSVTGDELILNGMGMYLLLALAECFFLDLPHQKEQEALDETSITTATTKKRTLSRAAIVTLLKPYFWPDATSDSAMVNRFRAIVTWICVILSKICNLISPMYLGWASTALAHEDYLSCVIYSILYSAIQFFGATFKEAQSLIYLKVAQAAFVQLSETTFAHLHSLSLDWHLRKKLGEVIRSMDRGIDACDTLMKYLFLWLLPALAECIVVCVIFATYFQYTPLAVSVFYFVWMYIVWTILVTLWRKKFRKAVVQSDNEWHDRCTDSLLNFETVKYFTAEDYESKRFGEAVRKYQAGSTQVQASLSFLNISQRLILQFCLAVALGLSVMGIQKRSSCCYAQGCESAVSECCRSISQQTCPGMQVGDFVAVLTYVAQLFAPLNFLGSVYNAVVMALIDLTNLSELLAEEPDVVDIHDAIPLPPTNKENPEIAVEFDNVYFHYPTQPNNKGLKGLSFTMKRGTTTAIVGPTGAGKTTISRLLFRFYDVMGGAIKVNGVDVRMLQQRSLRSAIGAVAQTASLFSDTIRANLRYGKQDATDEELEQAARDAQFLSFIESLDEGWDTLVGDRGLKLSGGERQRASIARCLLKDPPFVLLDEATSALDTLTENSVQEALDRLGTERTVLVIAHRLGTIRNADNIVVLKDGTVAEQGTHDQLLESGGLYAEMWAMQLHSNAGSQVSLTALDRN